ncbi:MAG TPA: hypothetical protein VF707_18915 [Ardenticatenaceae bacterium]
MMRRLIAYLLLIVTILMTLSACEIPGTGLPDDGPPIPVTEEAATSFQQKIQVAGQEAQATGSTTVSITQEEITSFLTLRQDMLEAQAGEQSGTQFEFPLIEPQVYFKDDGNIVVRGRIEYEGVNQPIRIVAQPTALNGTLEVNVTEGRIGPVPVPGVILDQVDNAVTQAILAGQDYGQITNLQVSGGTLTFSGQRTQ